MVGITTFPPFPPALFGLPGLTPLNWRAAWDINLIYTKNDGVYFNGSSYICIANNTAQQPDTSPTFWSLMTAMPAPIVNANIDPSAAIDGSKLATNSVTNTQLAQMATLTIKSNSTGTTANAVDNTLTNLLDAIISTTNGDILRRGASVWGIATLTGSGPIVLQTAPTINQINWVGDTTAAANPAAGSIGEVLSNTATGVSLVSATPKTIVTLSLTAGHWLVWGYGNSNVSGGAIPTFTQFSASLTTNVMGTAPAFVSTTFTTGANLGWTTNFGPKRFDVTSTTNLFGVANVQFSSGTVTADIGLFALRIF